MIHHLSMQELGKNFNNGKGEIISPKLLHRNSLSLKLFKVMLLKPKNDEYSFSSVLTYLRILSIKRSM